jgi:hypothetical protein
MELNALDEIALCSKEIHAHVSDGSLDLGYARLPFCWVAALDVPSGEEGPLPGTVAIQPLARSCGEAPIKARIFVINGPNALI